MHSFYVNGKRVTQKEAFEHWLAHGLIIIFIGIFYGLAETAHFGWNMFPESDAEMICDGIALLMTCMGFLAQSNRSR